MYKLATENLTRIDNDVNGNPRYVFHFLALADRYAEAVTVAKKLIGGKKFHNKQYGGGIVFLFQYLESTQVHLRINKLLTFLV